MLGGDGPTTSAIAFGGYPPSPTGSNATEEYTSVTSAAEPADIDFD